ncbi:MAG: hypothetical protein HYU31_06425 [Deltaproteobacteria bacterium]|nr:hypothetical protein [Deltaproteobacteria bacterium]
MAPASSPRAHDSSAALSEPGGTCLARIRFQDGQLRCFNNDLDNESCCYYFGVRRYWNPSHGVNAIRSKFFIRG